MKRRMLSVILTLSLVLSLLPTVTLTASAADFSGEGTQGNPYQIKTAQDLKNLATAVNDGDNQSGKYFKLMNNVDLGGSSNGSWVPIGTQSNPFSGAFDGGGYIITGLYIYDIYNGYKGLFGYNAGTIENLTVSGSVRGNSNTGGIVGWSSGTVQNCTNTATISCGSNTGGIVGWSSGTVKSCTNTATISGGSNTGGIVGESSGMVQNCTNTATITSSNNNVGGIVGNSVGESSLIENCYNTASVTGGSSFYEVQKTGGIAGYSTGTIRNCYNTGAVNGSHNFAGGILGHGEDKGRVVNCYNTGTVIGRNYYGGVIGRNGTAEYCYYDENKVSGGINGSDTPGQAESISTDALANANTFTSWDFQTVWTMSDDLHRPILQANRERVQFRGNTPYTVSATYGSGASPDLDGRMQYQNSADVAGKFEYIITGGNDNLLANIEGSTLKIPSLANAGNYSLTITAYERTPMTYALTPYGTGPVTLTVNVTIAKANPTVNWPTVGKTVYVNDDELTMDDLTSGSATGVDGETLDGSFSVTGTKTWTTSGPQTITVTFTPSDTTNYNTVTNQSVSVTVSKRVVESISGYTTEITGKAYGTEQSALGLPTTVTVQTADGKTFNDIPITWEGYRPDTLEQQTLTGTLDLSSISAEVDQASPAVTASVKVTLEERTSGTVTFENKTETYTGSPIEHEITDDDIDGVANITYQYKGAGETEYTESAEAPTDAGTYTVTATFEMEDGYAQIPPMTATLTIAPAPVSFTVSNTSQQYDGRKKEAEVTANAGELPFEKDTHYTVTYKQPDEGGELKEVEPVAVGSYEIWVEITNDNFAFSGDGDPTKRQVGTLTISAAPSSGGGTSSPSPGGGTSDPGPGGDDDTDPDGIVIIPEGGTVQTGDGPEMTLPKGGIMDKDGNVTADEIVIGDTTVKGNDVTADKDGNVTVPEGGTVQTGDGPEMTLPKGGTADKDGNVTADETVIGDTTVKGNDVTADKDGNVTVPEGGTVQTGDGPEMTLPKGGVADKDGDVTLPGGGSTKIAGTTVTVPDEGGIFTPNDDGTVNVPPGSKVVDKDGKEVIVAETGGKIDSEGIYTANSSDGPDDSGDSSNPGSSSGGGGGGGSSSPSTYPPAISKTEGGNVSTAPSNPKRGDTVTVTPTPDEGYEVGNVVVKDRNGNTLEVKDNGDGSFSFTQPTGKVTLEVTFVPGESEAGSPALTFSDLDPDAWYYEAVVYMVSRGLMNGYGDGIFGPNNTLSRAMLAQILYNIEGCVPVNYLMQYDDVPADAWYTEAIRWAASESIVSGYGNNKVGPNDPITREQLALMLYRYAMAKGKDVSVGENTNVLSYADAFDISEWAYSALQWACGTGIVSGKGNGVLDPSGQATRAETAAMLMRFLTR